MASKEIYKGTDLYFDEKDEVWYYQNDGARVWDQSLKKLKEKLDKFNRAKFDRIKIFLRINRYRSGTEKEWLETYGPATITSVDPNGNAFIVPEGEKHSRKESIRYNSYLYYDTPKNRKLIEQYHEQSRIKFAAEQKMKELEKKFDMVDGPALIKKIYGE